MADSTEQKIVARAVAVLAAINGSGSYQTTLGTTFVNGTSGQSLADSRPNWQQEELPAISIFQGQVTVEDRDDENQKVLRKLPLFFRGSLERGTDSQTARKFISDIMRAMRAAGYTWTVAGVNLAHHTDEGTHAIEYAEGTYEITGVEVQIDIYYIASKFDMEA